MLATATGVRWSEKIDTDDAQVGGGGYKGGCDEFENRFIAPHPPMSRGCVDALTSGRSGEM